MRSRLRLVALATSGMVALAFLIPLALLVRSVARDRALSAAERDAEALSPVLVVTTDPDELAGAIAATTAGTEGRLAAFLPDGTRVGAEFPLPPDSLELARGGSAFFTDADDGQLFLLPVLGRSGVSVIAVFVPDDRLWDGVAKSWAILGALGVGLVLVGVVVADRLGASVVRPVDRLADAARQLGQGDLEVRVEPAGPAEVAAVGSAFNHLAGRVGELLEAERESVADLSHRLRTPLTVLRMQTEVLPAGEEKDRLVEAADELERAVTGVIQEARRPIRTGRPAGVDICAVARERAEFRGALADDQGRSWTVSADGSRTAPVNQTDLEDALDALLGNIFSHTPDGTSFSVWVEHGADGGTRLGVEDAGPGLPGGKAPERGRSGGGSTGLGLDIARRTAEEVGGRFSVGPGDGDVGTRVTLEFPAPPSS